MYWKNRFNINNMNKFKKYKESFYILQWNNNFPSLLRIFDDIFLHLGRFDVSIIWWEKWNNWRARCDPSRTHSRKTRRATQKSNSYVGRDPKRRWSKDGCYGCCLYRPGIWQGWTLPRAPRDTPKNVKKWSEKYNLII